MARALQCPSCATTTPLEGRAAGETLRCESCGQVMRVPPGLSRRSGTAAATGAATANAGAAEGAGAVGGGGSGAPAMAPPAPRRKSRPTKTAGGAAAGAAVGAAAVASETNAGAPSGGTAVLAPEPPRPTTAPTPAKSRGASSRAAESGDGRDRLPLWLRIVVWVVALPLGLVIVGVPARSAGYLSSQKLLDVIVKHDLARFVPIVVIVALWALATALLVTLLVEGGRYLMLRRRNRAASRNDVALAGLDGAASGRGSRRSS